MHAIPLISDHSDVAWYATCLIGRYRSAPVTIPTAPSQETTGDAPMARDGHCAAYDAAAHRLVVFGGRGADRRRLNDVHHLDLSTWVWKRVITDGTGMLP